MLSFFSIFFAFLCIFLPFVSFYCHFGNGKIVKKNCYLVFQTFCYLVAPNTRNKCRNSWKASRQWRRIGQGSLPRGACPGEFVFWACLDEELSRLGVQSRLKNRVGRPDPGWNGPGGAAQVREVGPTWNSKTQLNQHASHLFAFFGIFQWESFFWHFPKWGSFFDRLPDPNEKTTRNKQCKKVENDKKTTKKWQENEKNDLTFI